MIVVGYEPFAGEPRPRVASGGPRLADVAANALDGLLLDQVAHDVRRMLAVNAFFAEHPTTGTSRAAVAYRAAHGRPPYRRISYALVAPSRRGRDRRAGRGGLPRAVWRVSRLSAHPTSRCSRGCWAAASARARGELLSFVLFDEVFIERLLKPAATDAERWLAAQPGFWSADAAAVGFDAPEVSAEAVALDEFRARRRH